MNISFSDFLPALSEISILFGILLMLIVAIIKLDQSTKILEALAPSIVLTSFVVLLLLPHTNVHTFGGTFVGDYFSYCGKFVILFVSFFLMHLSFQVRRYENLKPFEFILLISFCVLGMLFMMSSIDFIVSFISLEMVSLSSYVLVAMNKNKAASSEAGMKYFIYGSVATAFFLFGISFIYGATGSTHFDNIATDLHTTIVQQKDITLPVIGLIFILISFALKLGLAPVHFWLPDVFQGANLSVVLLLASAPKFAEIILLMRILFQALASLKVYWQPILLLFCILSLILGTFGALQQRNIKRFLAYSSTANMGFVILALAQGSEVGVASAGFYAAVYAITMFSILGLFMLLETKGYFIEKFEDLSIIAENHPIISFCFGFLILSLSGIPFSPGFFAKIYVLYAAMFQEAYTLSILAVVTSVISTGYYLNFLKSVSVFSVSKTVKRTFHKTSATLKISIISAFILMIGSLFFLNFWIYISHKAAISLMHQ